MADVHATVVSYVPTRIWIEDGIFGERAVVMQHEGEPPFDYAVFGYDWRYTSNATTHALAHQLAVSLGAVEPVEHRQRALPPGWADAMRAETSAG